MGGFLGPLAAAFACLLLTACSVPIADLPSPIGLPAGAPPRPAQQAEFPAVHDMPPSRDTTLLEPDEQRRIQRELERLRDNQAGRAGQQK